MAMFLKSATRTCPAPRTCKPIENRHRAPPITTSFLVVADSSPWPDVIIAYQAIAPQRLVVNSLQFRPDRDLNEHQGYGAGASRTVAVITWPAPGDNLTRVQVFSASEVSALSAGVIGFMAR